MSASFHATRIRHPLMVVPRFYGVATTVAEGQWGVTSKGTVWENVQRKTYWLLGDPYYVAYWADDNWSKEHKVRAEEKDRYALESVYATESKDGAIAHGRELKNKGTLVPAAPPANGTPATPDATKPPPEETPWYKNPWLYAGIGGAAVVGIGVYAVTRSPSK